MNTEVAYVGKRKSRRPEPGQCPRCAYANAEARRATAEREEVKRMLASTNGPAAAYREEAKKWMGSYKMLSHQFETQKAARLAEAQQRLNLSEQIDRASALMGVVKKQLWEVWSALSDDTPVKAQLWDVWSRLP